MKTLKEEIEKEIKVHEGTIKDCQEEIERNKQSIKANENTIFKVTAMMSALQWVYDKLCEPK